MTTSSFLQRPAVLLPLQFLCLWTLLFGARSFHFNDYANNEVDVLPSALQSTNPDWLPNDWYLNLDIGYRQLFNQMAGPLVSWLGFKQGALVGRALLYLLFAGVALYFIRTFQISFPLGVLALVPFLNNQSLIAGEWMVGGTETKAFAYAFVLLSLTLFYRRKWLAGFALAGAALSFHVLVGIFALLCAAGAVVLVDRKEFISEWQSILKKSWPLFLTGAWGLYAVFNQFTLDQGVNTSEAWNIYIHYRVPHHVFPGAWGQVERFAILGLGTLLAVAAAFYGRSRNLRFLGYYALGSIGLFTIGLLVYAVGATDLLRYYWFRFPDTIVPFLTIMLITLLASERIRGAFPLRTQKNKDQQRIPKWSARTQMIISTLGGLTVAIVIIITAARIYSRFPGIEDAANKGWGDAKARPMLTWIKDNTPRQAIFLADPTMQSFYVQAERATLVSFKHSPQSAPDILEWYRRLTLCNGGVPPSRGDFDMNAELRKNFYSLSPESIRHIAQLYGTAYYLGKIQHPLPFQEVHRDAGLILYKIDTQEPLSALWNMSSTSIHITNDLQRIP